MSYLFPEFIRAVSLGCVEDFAGENGWRHIVDDWKASEAPVAKLHQRIANLVLTLNRSQKDEKEEPKTKIPTLITKTITRVNPTICQSASVGVALYYPDGTFQKIPTFSDCIEQSEHSIRDWFTAHINAVMEKES